MSLLKETVQNLGKDEKSFIEIHPIINSIPPAYSIQLLKKLIEKAGEILLEIRISGMWILATVTKEKN